MTTASPTLGASDLSLHGQARFLKPRSPLQVCFLLFSVSILAFVLRVLIGGTGGWLTTGLSIAGSVSCGLAWLLARALFRPSGKVGTWPIAFVAGLFASFLLLMGADALRLADAPAARVLNNLHTLAASTVLLMTLFEAIDGMGKGAGQAERRFRLLFVGGYAALLGISVVWLGGVSNDSGPVETAKAICAMLALAGAGLAVAYRQRSLATPQRRERAGDGDLARRLRHLIEAEQLYRNPEIKVRDVARYLNEPEYKVSQCITGALGCANFNRLINAYRIEAAKEMLANEAMECRSILSIAMDCGFGSIGPFNRAFKDLTGCTPSEYRVQAGAR